MKAGNPVEVLDPYKWLPGYGESSIELMTRGLDLVVIIGYDGENDSYETRELIFNRTCSFTKCNFPGIEIFDIQYDTAIKPNLPFGSLVEYVDSEPARSWASSKFNKYEAIVKHYQICFLSENCMLTVFAESFTLSKAITNK